MKLRFNQVAVLWLRQHWWLVPAILLALLLGWGFGNWHLLQTQAQQSLALQQQGLQLQQVDAARADALRQRDFLSTELAVERNTNLLLQQDIKDHQQKLFDLKKELARMFPTGVFVIPSEIEYKAPPEKEETIK